MGITRDTIFTILKEMGFVYKIDKITKENLFNADEVFYCGSASEVTPIREIDDHKVSGGKAGELTLKLQKMYYEIVRGKHQQYYHWLTFVD
jgi:branched-chain amino acid aminotransferase